MDMNYKLAKFHAKILNRSENIPTILGGYFLNTLYIWGHGGVL